MLTADITAEEAGVHYNVFGPWNMQSIFASSIASQCWLGLWEEDGAFPPMVTNTT